MIPPAGAATAVLGIETSCDETAAAVVAGGHEVRSSVVTSQIDLHRAFGGVVPEIAGRAHLQLLPAAVEQALAEAEIQVPDRVPAAVAATAGPGLLGALVVGVSAAKALALAWDVPFVAVNHLEAHLYAAFLDGAGHTGGTAEPPLPMIVLLVSGGHTMLVEMTGHGRYELLGQTLDDAAGEAYDK
ncbi:MAG: tRNA (adenosine(37)-N6)-threonylcarbamoyltransferase complex transferase subunit TsaD, partial [Acidimicrobiia bacterium]|nr:tRNA (adenosine(37)-N6)-threonylcarbamoyltransferase complex transferase subunit TsaD [Acidimicrobiia bacterium]